MARVTISGPSIKVMPAELGGTPHTGLKAWFDFAKGQKSVIATTVNGISAIEVNSEDISMAPLLLSLSQGFTVEGAPVFIKMTPTKYALDVPEGIRNREYLNADEETVVRTWVDWHDNTHEHMDATDGDKIVAGNSWGAELSSDELLVLLGGGYTLYLGHEIAQFLPAPEL